MKKGVLGMVKEGREGNNLLSDILLFIERRIWDAEWMYMLSSKINRRKSVRSFEFEGTRMLIRTAPEGLDEIKCSLIHISLPGNGILAYGAIDVASNC